jgi:O-antigen ligase
MQRLPLALYTLGLVAACWLGGRIHVAPIPIEPGSEFRAILLERSLPHVSQLIIAVLILGGYLVALLRFGVLLLPHPRLTFAAMAVMLAFAFSAGSSIYKHDAAMEFLRWIVYFGAFFAGTVLVGRSRGPTIALACIFGGVCLVAAGGVYEYALTAPSAPNWRIMAGWQNPNAAAGLFAIGVPLGFGLLLDIANRDGDNRRALLLVCGAGCGVVMSALWLTASKGGMLSALVGVVALVGFAIAFSLRKRAQFRKGWSRALLIPIATLALVLAAAYLPASKRGVAQSRVFAAGAEAEQSVGFRKRLWTDTVAMVRSAPALGVGLGSFAPAFPRHSTTQGSAVAHNSYLQFAAEAGLVGLFVLLAFVVAWIYTASGRHDAAPPSHGFLRAGVLASVFAGGANAVVESALSYFGFTLILLALMGIALTLTPDGARTERIAFPARIIVGLSAFGIVVWYFAVVSAADIAVGGSLSELSAGNGEQALRRLNSVAGSSFPYSVPNESRARVFIARAHAASEAGEIARAAKDAYAATSDLEMAIRSRPTAANYALLGDAFSLTPDKADAEAAYDNAIALAPASPIYKRRLFEFLKDSGNTVRAEKLAQTLIRAESSDWFKLNALPWVVSTDTVGARLFLARLSLEKGDDGSAISLLEGAFEILASYRVKTYTELLRITGGEPELKNSELAGQSLAGAERKFAELEAIAAMLEELYAKVANAEKKASIRERVEKLRAIGG